MTRATACAGQMMTTGFGVGDGAGFGDAAVGAGEGAIGVEGAVEVGEGAIGVDGPIGVGEGAIGVDGAPVLVHAPTSRATMTNGMMDANRMCVMAV